MSKANGKPNGTLPPGARVFTYVRDSGGETQGESCDQQLAVARAYRRTHNLVDAGEFVDRARSGGSDKRRDDFQRLVETAQPGAASGILFWSTARMARNVDDGPYYRGLFRKNGYRLIYLADAIPDVGNLTPLLEVTKDIFNAERLAEISREARRGLDALIYTHKCVPGAPPIGYRREAVQLPDHRDGSARFGSRWVVDPATAPHVRQAWQMRADGYSLESVHQATRLFARKGSYPKFFRNEIYRGVLIYGERRVENFVEPLCTAAQWAAVQSLRDNPIHPRTVASPYFLSGLLRCGVCGDAMRGRHQYMAKQRGDKRYVYRHRYYLCNRKHTRYSACPSGHMRKDEVEQAVVQEICDTLLSPERLARLVADSKPAHGLAALSQERQEMARKLAAIETAISRLLDALESGGSVGERLHKRENERDELRAKLAQLDASRLRQQSETITPEELAAYAERLRAAFDEADWDAARVALRRIVARIEFINGKAKVWFRKPSPAASRADTA